MKERINQRILKRCIKLQVGDYIEFGNARGYISRIRSVPKARFVSNTRVSAEDEDCFDDIYGQFVIDWDDDVASHIKKMISVTGRLLKKVRK